MFLEIFREYVMSGKILDSLQRIAEQSLRFEKSFKKCNYVMFWHAFEQYSFVCNAFPFLQTRETKLIKLDSLLLEFAKRAAVCY